MKAARQSTRIATVASRRGVEAALVTPDIAREVTAANAPPAPERDAA